TGLPFGRSSRPAANRPGAAPRTATFALTNATAPYARRLADIGVAAAIADPTLRSAANVLAGKVTHKGVAEAFGYDYVAPDAAI
ncbi:MAG: hypothetical protein ACO3UM_12990, partial [Planctomycetota bacterium]